MGAEKIPAPIEGISIICERVFFQWFRIKIERSDRSPMLVKIGIDDRDWVKIRCPDHQNLQSILRIVPPVTFLSG
jgi:hypothetical protein